MSEEDIATTCYLNYESKTHAIDSRSSGSFSVRFRIVERTLVRSPPNGRETLAEQRTFVQSDNAAIKSKIPPTYLADEATCSGYVSNVLSKANFYSILQEWIVPKICKDMINTGLEGGFLVDAIVEIVREKSLNNYLSLEDYDFEGLLIATEQDCVICLEELSLGGERKIMKLLCSHSFHKDCLVTWLQRKHSCPTCRDDIENPRPKKEVPRMIPFEI